MMKAVERTVFVMCAAFSVLCLIGAAALGKNDLFPAAILAAYSAMMAWRL